ncbi:MAG: PAS domain-containing protein [Desulfovibrionales bacterium]|nr:PAS domain-containing protein [Desulfovibrionales bacterium]
MTSKTGFKKPQDHRPDPSASTEKSSHFSGEKFFNLIENAAVAVQGYSQDGTVIYWNKASEALYGYKASEAIGKNLVDIIIPEKNKARIVAEIKKMADTQVPASCEELALKTKDGSTVYVYSSHTMVMNKSGCLELFCIDVDLTHFKWIESKLRDSIENKKVLLDNIQTQVWYLVSEERYGAVNKAHADFIGLPADEIAFHNMDDFLPESAAQICRQSNRMVYETGKIVYSEEWVPDSSGEERLLSIVKSPGTNSDGQVEFVVCSAEDITDTRKAENALKRNEEKFRKIVDVLPQLIAYVDKHLIYKFVNKSYERIFQVKSEDIAGKHIKDIIGHDAFQKARQYIEKVLEGETVTYSDRYNYPDGVRYIDGTLIPDIDESGQILGYYAVLEDVTRFKR